MTFRTRTLAAGLLASALALPLVLNGPGHGQPAPDQVKALRNVGSANCMRCHREPLPEDKEQKVTDFIRLDEATVFRQYDLHALAYRTLSEPLGQQMGRLMGVDVTQDVRCLACHAINLSQELSPGQPRPGRSLAEFHTADGVGCEACHGIADKWFRDHIDKNWRTVPPEKKLADFGERDMRDPVARAERCAACHVGNAAEGKFVTHEMYAAGHPPLPPLEVMTFSRDQPMHYKLAKDLPYLVELAAKDDSASWKLFHYRKGESQPARQVAVGAVVTFREAMKTLAHAAGAAGSSGAMLDFAHFDCAACHHELESPSWRQERGFVTTPGRPPPFTGPTALLRAVLGHAATTDAPGPVRDLAGAFDAKYTALMKAFDARPFGDPAAVAPAARELIQWSDDVVKGLEGIRYDDAQTVRLLRAVGEAASRKPTKPGTGLGYDDAQQLLWAFDVLRSERPGLAPEVAAEVQKLGGPEKDKPFLLRLKEKEQAPPVRIAAELPLRLRRVANYQPEPFRQAFDRITGALKP